MKTTIICGLLICSTMFILRTPLKARDVYAGFAFGPAYNYINSPNLLPGSINSLNIEFKPSLTYSLNAHLSVQFASFGLSFEPGYIKKGGRSTDFQKNGWSVQYNYHFIQLPLLLDIYLTPRFYVSLGGDFSYLLPIGSTNSGNNNSPVTFYDIAAIGSLSYSLTSHLDLALRYNHGFRTQPGSKIDVTHNFNYNVGAGKNMHGQLLLRVKFGGASANDSNAED